MTEPILTAFWIEGFDPNGALGYGVTAFSLDDALEIVSRAGHSLPADTSLFAVHENVNPIDLPHQYIRDQMGPIVVRGVWYPFVMVGMGANE